jgi:hypothetical protein
MNIMWWIALVIATYLISVLVFNNPFGSENRKIMARRMWAERTRRAASEHYPEDQRPL